MADYGAFCEIAPGVGGSYPRFWKCLESTPSVSVSRVHGAGDEVVAILTLDRDERKMSFLGIKQLKEDPWETIEVKYPIGSKHTAKVCNHQLWHLRRIRRRRWTV